MSTEPENTVPDRDELVHVLNLETGETGDIPRKWFEHEIINPGVLVEVDPEQKPYVQELWKSKVEDTEDEEPVATGDHGVDPDTDPSTKEVD